ncbi:MAG: hypothetical protein HQM13_04055 [SAR324 cluster bacterium]|nr:hypothetical protein [SAR324 cluster bacterium]
MLNVENFKVKRKNQRFFLDLFTIRARRKLKEIAEFEYVIEHPEELIVDSYSVKLKKVYILNIWQSSGELKIYIDDILGFSGLFFMGLDTNIAANPGNNFRLKIYALYETTGESYWSLVNSQNSMYKSNNVGEWQLFPEKMSGLLSYKLAETKKLIEKSPGLISQIVAKRKAFEFSVLKKHGIHP